MSSSSQSVNSKQDLLVKLRGGQEGIEAWNKWRLENPHLKPDLEKADLERAQLWDANLANTNLKEANLNGAYLQRANLAGSYLFKANLSGANLDKCDLTAASGSFVNLEGAFLEEAKARGVRLTHINLTEAKLSKADLSGSDLTECYLTGANLTSANLATTVLANGHLDRALLRDADLSGAYLGHADLRGADLQGANLNGADLFQASLRDATLKGTDLSCAKAGVLPGQLAGADLTAAKLPEPVAKLYEKLGSVSEISDSAKKLFLALLAACLYSWLTITTTTDVDLITNRASTPLPIIQTAIPIVGFYVVAPLILLCIYFYFHFYLQKLWEELGSLPAIFTDGRPLHARADPWLFNDLVRAHFPKLNKDRPFMSYFQQWMSIVIAWWLVPITLLLFWGRYLRRHDLFWTLFHALILALSMVAGWRLYRLARETLRGEERRTLKQSLRRPGPYIGMLVAVAWVLIAVAVSVGAIFGVPFDGLATFHRPRMWVSRVMDVVDYSPFANLIGADVSIKPQDWSGSDDKDFDRVKGADLMHRNLRHSSADRAFLVKAQMQGSDLQGARFWRADLRQANLEEANLARAHLVGALMQGANLRLAQLGGADLSGAHLDHAHLQYATLSGASLGNAFFLDADMNHANLKGASLSQAQLVGANLSVADLQGADLRVAKLTGADLTGANLTKARLGETECRYADFQGTKGLTANEIINGFLHWKMAFFDDDMIKQLGLPPDHNRKLEEQRSLEQQRKN